jgi:hypothetical protein
MDNIFDHPQGEMRPSIQITVKLFYGATIIFAVWTVLNTIGGTYKMLCASSSVPSNVKIEAKCPGW